MQKLHLLLLAFAISSSVMLQGQTGCTDVDACNFDPFAIEDDGSCTTFIDCAGVCGGTFIQDACGNCYDPNGIADNGNQEFTFTSNEQSFIVPTGVTQLLVQCYGAQGQGSGAGLGGYATGVLNVTPGETIYIYVGGQDGYNGGGIGAPGRNGGGASDIRQGNNTLQDRVIVAAGGGGAGAAGPGGNGGAGETCPSGAAGLAGFCQGCNPYAGSGGNGTCSAGGNGGISSGGFSSGGGGAGLTAGGGGSPAGGYGTAGENGTFGQGGNRGVNSQYNICNSGAGGGGGYYGGGGSADAQCAAGGGGGGSSYIGGVSNGTTQGGSQSGNGLVVIQWTGSPEPECNAGCTDPNACNFDSEATVNDNSCQYPDGCNDPAACNYDANATCNDGTCTYPGCNNETACNFDPNAACNDGSCIFIVDCAGVCGGNFISDACGNCYDPNAFNESFSQNFSLTSNEQSFIVPNGVTELLVECYGAQGQGSGAGLGGYATGVLNVTPGETIYIYVGGQDGYNGGGTGAPGRNGGGASDIRQGNNTLQDRVIVAAGGGGAGAAGPGGNGGAGETCPSGAAGLAGFCQGCSPYAGSGGNGTCSAGGNGGIASGGFSSGGGGAGLAAGGAGSPAGGYGTPGQNGTLGQGGDRGVNSQYNICNSGAGGGGGYYGGGGSADAQCAAGGGGGGSSYIGGVSNGTTQGAIQSGNGQVVIIWEGTTIAECNEGCTDPQAANFDPSANVDNGTCIFLGCTNPMACNFNASANQEDDSCILPDGCTDANACNYSVNALCNDGSCIFPDPFKDCQGNCLNDFDLDGICDELEVLGCTYPAAANFNPLATNDDGSCTLVAPENVCGFGTFWDPNSETCIAFTDCPADINGDGIVNANDLLTFLSSYGTTCQ